MDRAIEKNWEAFRRIAARLLSLAAIAERAAGRSYLIRCLVLWLLRPAEATARAFAVEIGLAVIPARHPASRWGSSADDAMRLARTFCALASAFRTRAHQALRFARSSVSRRQESSGLPCRQPDARNICLAANQPRYADTS